jgi:hypothetical protein
MGQSGIKTRPMLRGPLASAGPWQAILGQPNKRIYPFTLGAVVDTASSGTTIQCGGLGDFAATEYIIVCNATAYGNATLFIPDTGKIRQISSVSGAEDDIIVDAAVSVAVGDYIFNIGNDGAATPKVSPDLDDIITLTDDPYGVTANSNGYLLTGTGGHFRGWVAASVTLVDILITDASKNIEMAIPFVTTGAEA